MVNSVTLPYIKVMTVLTDFYLIISALAESYIHALYLSPLPHFWYFWFQFIPPVVFSVLLSPDHQFSLSEIHFFRTAAQDIDEF